VKEIISCAMCKSPQCADLYEIHLTQAKATNGTFDKSQIYLTDYICHRCVKTAEYKNKYLLCQQEHCVLPEKTEVRYN